MALIHDGTTIPLKNEKPRTKRFLESFKFTYCNEDNPTATMRPNKHQNIPPITGLGISVKTAPNLPRMDNMIIKIAPI